MWDTLDLDHERVDDIPLILGLATPPEAPRGPRSTPRPAPSPSGALSGLDRHRLDRLYPLPGRSPQVGRPRLGPRPSRHPRTPDRPADPRRRLHRRPPGHPAPSPRPRRGPLRPGGPALGGDLRGVPTPRGAGPPRQHHDVRLPHRRRRGPDAAGPEQGPSPGPAPAQAHGRRRRAHRPDPRHRGPPRQHQRRPALPAADHPGAGGPGAIAGCCTAAIARWPPWRRGPTSRATAITIWSPCPCRPATRRCWTGR